MPNNRLVVILGSTAALVLLSIGAFFWLQSRGARGLAVEMQAPDQALVGVPFDFQVNISNKSGSVLQKMSLALNLPEDVVFLGQPAEKNTDFKNIGNLGPGSLTQEIFKLMVIGGENSVKRVKAEVSYAPSNIGAQFEKSATFDLSVGGGGLALDLIPPAKVFSGEDFETEIFYKNVSESDYSDLKLIVDYPPSFTFEKATLPPDSGNREWDLGGLRPGSENKFNISGSMIGPDNAFLDIRARIEGRFLGQFYKIAEKTASIAISPSPLSLSIGLNESPDYIAKPGDILNYSLNYSNNTDVALKDVVIKIQLIGEMYDLATLNTNGALNSFSRTITWNASNSSGLNNLPIGGSGLVNFQIKTTSSYPIRRLSDKNFTLKANAEIESPTVPFFVAAERIIGIARLETKVLGLAEIDAKAFFRDAASGIVNSGPFPPKAGQPTQYTVHWILKNYSTDISGVAVKAFLGPNVRFTGVTRSNAGTLPNYNDRTQEVIWLIDKVAATKGVLGAPLEVVFQIEATPSSAGNYWPLIGETLLEATDDFTGVILTDTDFAITTALPDDTTVSGQSGIVRE